MGYLALHGIHPEGTPLGRWVDAFWAAWVDYLLRADTDRGQAIEKLWGELTAERPTPAPEPEPGPESAPTTAGQRPPRRRPTAAEKAAWGTSPEAQRGQQNLQNLLRAGG